MPQYFHIFPLIDPDFVILLSAWMTDEFFGFLHVTVWQLHISFYWLVNFETFSCDWIKKCDFLYCNCHWILPFVPTIYWQTSLFFYLKPISEFLQICLLPIGKFCCFFIETDWRKSCFISATDRRFSCFSLTIQWWI